MNRVAELTTYILALSLIGWEIAIGLTQMAGLTNSLHPYHSFTGTFFNSGPYACFLAIGFPLAVRWGVTANGKLQKLTGIGVAALSVILIPSTMSRTACVACTIGCVVALFDIISYKCRLWRKAHWWVALTILSVVSIGAYLIKKESADGRLLIWKVATQAAIASPLNGVGWDNVAGAYGEAQENYFKSGCGSETEILVADAPEYVFNEYLQVAIAYGIPVAITVTVILLGGIIVAIRNKSLGLAGSATAIAVVMIASYPLQFPVYVIAIGLILIGCYLSSRYMMVNIPASIAVVALCTLFLTHNRTVDIRTGFSLGHSLHKIKEHRKSNDNLLSLLSHSSDPMILNIIGKNYQSLGMPDSAEHYLMKSVNRCPNRLYPHYLLMNLYADSASYDQDKLLREAEILVNKKEKIPSPAVDEMRAKAREILKTIGQ